MHQVMRSVAGKPRAFKGPLNAKEFAGARRKFFRSNLQASTIDRRAA